MQNENVCTEPKYKNSIKTLIKYVYLCMYRSLYVLICFCVCVFKLDEALETLLIFSYQEVNTIKNSMKNFFSTIGGR